MVPAGSLGVEAICKALKSAGSSGLKELNLSHTAADDKAAAALAGLLASSRVLERLVLSSTSISDAGAQLLCNALQVGGAVSGGLRNCRLLWHIGCCCDRGLIGASA